jgi:gliding motility-associated-like protein
MISMKKVIIAAILSLFFVNFGFAQPTDRLIAYYPFSQPAQIVNSMGDTVCAQQANDAVFPNGGGSTGAPGTIPPAACVCGVAGLAARFDGIDDSYLCFGPVTDVFKMGDFTVSFYIKPFPQTGTQVILSKHRTDDCTQRAHSFAIRYNYSSNKITANINESDKLQATVSTRLDEGRCWQHILVIKQNAKFRLYVNGTLRDEDVSPKRLDLTNNTTLFSIAKPICPSSEKYFKGDLDELRIYNRALNADEIAQCYLRPDMIGNRDTLIYLGNSVQIFTTNTCATDFKWTPTAGVSDPNIRNPVISPTVSSTYRVTFIHPECIASDTVFIKVIDPDTLDCAQIFLPNAFTPNNDGRNDTYFISNPFAVPDLISFEIFDRWGGRVFSTNIPNGEWDGTFKGKPVNPGIYLYRLNYRCENIEKVRNGSLTLLR